MSSVASWPLEAPFTLTFCLSVLALLALVWLTLFIEHSYQQQSDYRCAGLILLAQSRSCREVHQTLRRVALTAYPGYPFQRLSANAWVGFLNRNCAGSCFKTHWMVNPDARASDELVREARRWILNHHRLGEL